MCLKNQLRKNLEAYINDVVVKTKTADKLIADLEQTFDVLKKFK
jgi:hypothetical protein